MFGCLPHQLSYITHIETHTVETSETTKGILAKANLDKIKVNAIGLINSFNIETPAYFSKT